NSTTKSVGEGETQGEKENNALGVNVWEDQSYWSKNSIIPEISNKCPRDSDTAMFGRVASKKSAGYIRNQGEFKNPITHAEHTNDFGGASGERQPSANPQKAHYSQQGGFNPIT
ncbi:unnamed protein product, partial [Owenia fusiformis]